MNHSSQTSKYRVLFSLFLGCAALSACEVDEEVVIASPSSPSCESEQLSDPNSLCQESGMILATQAECDAGLECQMLSMPSECGEEVTALCHMPSDPECLDDGYIPLEAICEARGLILATAEECEMDPTCRSIINAGPCDSEDEVFCIDPSCTEEAFPTAEVICQGEGLTLASEEECNEGIDCQTFEFLSDCNVTSIALCRIANGVECDEDGRVEPSIICEGEGLVLATDEECVDNVTCQTITSNGPCDMTFETLCKEPEGQCLALPSCSPGTVPSAPCLRGEESCETVTICEETISCRPELACNAAPACDEGEVASRFACEEGEDDCSVVTMCADTIFCRPNALCRATPSCGEGEVASLEPCLATESDMACRAVSMCGTTIACR